MGLVTTTGYLHFEVNVTCPHCGGLLDLNQHPYNDDDKLGMALFGSDVEPPKWDGLDIEYQCNHCKKYFVLTKIEY